MKVQADGEATELDDIAKIIGQGIVTQELLLIAFAMLFRQASDPDAARDEVLHHFRQSIDRLEIPAPRSKLAAAMRRYMLNRGQDLLDRIEFEEGV